MAKKRRIAWESLRTAGTNFCDLPIPPEKMGPQQLVALRYNFIVEVTSSRSEYTCNLVYLIDLCVQNGN